MTVRRFATWGGLLVVLLVGLGAAAYMRRRETPAPARPVTFARDVAPIIFAHCSSCHHPDESAPFSLLTYDDARRRARQLVEVTQSGFMPPWMPAAGHGDFVGTRRLTADERQTLKLWADAGTPPGDPAETLAAPVFADPWASDPPDIVLETPLYHLAAQGRDVFRNFVVTVPFDSPRWVASVELRPGNPRVTHHARLGVDSSNESVRRDAEDAEPGYDGMAWGQDPDGQLVLWAPGMTAPARRPGVAWRLYPRTSLVLHAHMQPSGKPEVVTFRVGVRFAKGPPEVSPAILRVGSCDIDIPAGARRHTVEDEFVVPVDVDVQTIFPHAHSLCRSVRVVADRPDDTRESLIAIEAFDENWHDSYRYRQPVRLPRGSRLRSTFVYDNTDDNPRNRSRPARRVVYGSNVTDEMADVYLQVTPAHADERAALLEDYKRYELRSQAVGYRRALDLRPDDPWSQEGLATCCVGLGEPRAAVAILEGRLRNGPKAVYPVVGLGMALLAGGDATAAEARFREGITLDAEYPLAWFGLGRALVARGQPDEAEKAFRRAMALAPGLSDARLSLADVLIRRGQLDAAWDVCTATLSDSPDASAVHLKLAEISAKRRDYDGSLAHCTEARRLAPYTHPPKVLLAVLCIGNGDAERGLKLLEEAWSESPDHPMAALLLGQLARRRQAGTAARDYLTAAAARRLPDNWPASHKQRFRVSLHSERWQLAQQLNDLALARDALAQWIECDPSNPQLQKWAAEMATKRRP